MKKFMAVIVTAMVLLGSSQGVRAQEEITNVKDVGYVTPPETSIGGAALLGSIVMVLRAEAKRARDKTAQSSRARSTARSLAVIGIGGIALGWLSVSYYERRLGVSMKIEF